MISKLKYIVRRNLYHIIFGIFILVIFILLKALRKTLEMRMKFIAYYEEKENRQLYSADEFREHLHGFDGIMRMYANIVYMKVFKYPFLFWCFFGVSILQMWYFTSRNYKFYSLDFLIYVIIIILSRFPGAGVGVFGGGWIGGIFYGFLPELILFFITSLITMKTNSKLYSSDIHYPSLITLVICCIIISLLAVKGFFDAKNEIDKTYKQYSNTGFVS